MSNVIPLFAKRVADDPDAVLEAAKGTFGAVYIVGYDKNGGFIAFASTNITTPEIVCMMEHHKHMLFSGDYEPVFEDDDDGDVA